MASGKLVCAAEVVRTTEDGSAAARFAECRFLLGAWNWRHAEKRDRFGVL